MKRVLLFFAPEIAFPAFWVIFIGSLVAAMVHTAPIRPALDLTDPIQKAKYEDIADGRKVVLFKDPRGASVYAVYNGGRPVAVSLEPPRWLDAPNGITHAEERAITDEALVIGARWWMPAPAMPYVEAETMYYLVGSVGVIATLTSLFLLLAGRTHLPPMQIYFGWRFAITVVVGVGAAYGFASVHLPTTAEFGVVFLTHLTFWVGIWGVSEVIYAGCGWLRAIRAREFERKPPPRWVQLLLGV